MSQVMATTGDKRASKHARTDNTADPSIEVDRLRAGRWFRSWPKPTGQGTKATRIDNSLRTELGWGRRNKDNSEWVICGDSAWDQWQKLKNAGDGHRIYRPKSHLEAFLRVTNVDISVEQQIAKEIRDRWPLATLVGPALRPHGNQEDEEHRRSYFAEVRAVEFRSVPKRVTFREADLLDDHGAPSLASSRQLGTVSVALANAKICFVVGADNRCTDQLGRLGDQPHKRGTAEGCVLLLSSGKSADQLLWDVQPSDGTALRANLRNVSFCTAFVRRNDHVALQVLAGPGDIHVDVHPDSTLALPATDTDKARQKIKAQVLARRWIDQPLSILDGWDYCVP